MPLSMLFRKFPQVRCSRADFLLLNTAVSTERTGSIHGVRLLERVKEPLNLRLLAMYFWNCKHQRCSINEKAKRVRQANKTHSPNQIGYTNRGNSVCQNPKTLSHWGIDVLH